jgi:hypothetical protein
VFGQTFFNKVNTVVDLTANIGECVFKRTQTGEAVMGNSACCCIEIKAT